MPLGASWDWRRGVAAGALAAVLLSALGLALDLDADGDNAWQELRAGTHPWDGDTDGDGLEDGWERRAGLDGRVADADGDGLTDGDELRRGADPRSSDTDGDGLPDADEAHLPDCDGDGLGAIAEGDGDADGRLDTLEDPRDRCTRDADGDGVLDGSEGNAACVRVRDCDRDGLPDGQEPAGFDPLDPDSFGSGVSDSVSFAFQQAGQAPGADADQDGIPDPWEDDDGLIVWGDLRPQAGQRDFLVEFIRVQGPDSGRSAFAQESFAPAYQFVADMLRTERGVHMRWIETVVSLNQEAEPELVPQLEDPYYAAVLAQGQASTNPYVTTVVLNPQHDQSDIVHAGVAPIRGMLAAVDYGAHMQVTFRSLDGNVTVSLSPLVESLIRGGRADELADLGFRGGTTNQGDIGLESLATGNQLIWTPWWFASAPRLVQGGTSTVLQQVDVTVYHGSLAGTILHELGHTLGLCHAHDETCNAAFSAADRANQASSTMSYDSPSNLLHFLNSEWTTVLQYLACPPDDPITEVATGAPATQILAAKYAYSNKDLLDVGLRACRDFMPVPRQFEAGTPAAHTFLLPPAWQDPADRPRGPALWLFGLAFLAGAVTAAGWFAGRWQRAAPPS